MNTPSENAYQELFSGPRMKIVTTETRTRTYDIQISKDILNDFENWKIEFLQDTDEQPTELDILDYFKSISTIRFSSDSSEDLQVVSRSMYIGDEDHDLFDED
jgi:uncharacterized protein YjbK